MNFDSPMNCLKKSKTLAGELAEQLGVPYGFESSQELTKTCGSQEHQGYLAKMPPYPYDDLTISTRRIGRTRRSFCYWTAFKIPITLERFSARRKC